MRDILVGVLNIALITIAIFTGFFIFIWVALAVLVFYAYLRIRVWLAMRDLRKYGQQRQGNTQDPTIIDAEYVVIQHTIDPDSDSKTGKSGSNFH